MAIPEGGDGPMNSNRKQRRRIEKLTQKAIKAYIHGGCLHCGCPAEDYARYIVGHDISGRVIACCDSCSDGAIVSILADALKWPDPQGTQWAMHDAAFFNSHPERRLHVREPWGQEAKIFTKMMGLTRPDLPGLAMLVAQLEPGVNGRIIGQCFNPDEVDASGDAAIAATTGCSLPVLLAKLQWQMENTSNVASMQDERAQGLAWTTAIADPHEWGPTVDKV